MEAIEQLQRQLGAPVIGFAQQFWIPLVILALLIVWYVFFREPGGGTSGSDLTVELDGFEVGGDGGGDD